MSYQASLNLDCRLFDVFGFLIERVMKSLDTRLMYSEIIPMIRTILVRYPLEYQEWYVCPVVKNLLNSTTLVANPPTSCRLAQYAQT